MRFAPNDLYVLSSLLSTSLTFPRDFATASSYQDIYGTATKGRRQFLKGDWYDLGSGGTPSVLISNERDPVKHREARKLLAPAFSSSALRAQTDVVLHYVNMWIEQIKKHGNTAEGINIDEVSPAHTAS